MKKTFSWSIAADYFRTNLCVPPFPRTPDRSQIHLFSTFLDFPSFLFDTPVNMSKSFIHPHADYPSANPATDNWDQYEIMLALSPYRPYMDNISKNVQKWFWALHNDMLNKWYKSGVKVVLKWSREDLWPLKHHFPSSFWQIEHPKWGRRPKAAPSICQKLKGKLCFK